MISLNANPIFGFGLGSLIDFVNGSVPTFFRPGYSYVEYLKDNNIFSDVDIAVSNQPAFSRVDGSVVIEPVVSNLVSWNLSFERDEWSKGSSSVNVQEDRIFIPYGNTRGDVVSFTSKATGTSTRELYRVIECDILSEMCFSANLLYIGGELGFNDYIEIRSEYIEESGSDTKFYLAELMNHRSQFKKISIPFTTLGRDLEGIIDSEIFDSVFTVVSHDQNSMIIQLIEDPESESNPLADITANELEGLYLTFPSGIQFEIIQNNAPNLTNNQIRIYFKTIINLYDYNIVTGINSEEVKIIAKYTVPVTIVIHVENVASIGIAGMQIEQKPYSTSMLLQNELMLNRGSTTFIYPESPLTGLTRFSLVLDLLEWKGSGCVLKNNNLELEITDNNIYCHLGDAVVYAALEIDKPNKIIITADNESRIFALYINNKLIRYVTLDSGFTFLPGSLEFCNTGVRKIKSFLIFDYILNGGVNQEGAIAINEIGLVSNDPYSAVPIELLSSNKRTVKLGSVRVPPKPSFTVMVSIDTVTVGTEFIEVTLSDAEVVVENQPYLVLSSDKSKPITMITLSQINTTNNTATTSIAIDSSVTLTEDMVLVLPNEYRKQGKAMLRFPYKSIDFMIVEAISGNTITVNNANAYTVNERCFIKDRFYNEKLETLVTGKPSSTTLTLLNTNGISVGDIIEQPIWQLEISPSNYLVRFANEFPGILKLEKFTNMIVIYNDYSYAVDLDILLDVAL